MFIFWKSDCDNVEVPGKGPSELRRAWSMYLTGWKPRQSFSWLWGRIPNGSRTSPSLTRYSLKVLFSYPMLLFLFLILGQVWSGFLVCTQPIVMIPLGGRCDWEVLWSDHLVICPVDLESIYSCSSESWLDIC